MTSSPLTQKQIQDCAEAGNQRQIDCEACALSRLCLPLGLHREELDHLSRLVRRQDRVSRGQTLFEMHSPFHCLYVVRSGAFKTTISVSDGRQQVSGFYFPGEFIGLDAIFPQQYQSRASALEDSSVCLLPYSALETLSQQLPGLQNQLLTRLSKELSADKNLLLSLGQKSASEKLLTFLLSLSRRFADRGFSANQFELPMTRADMANHLGLAVETVSRELKRLQQQSLISISGKQVKINAGDEIARICS
jgi:CRP/FNR family transcriptional regulator